MKVKQKKTKSKNKQSRVRWQMYAVGIISVMLLFFSSVLYLHSGTQLYDSSSDGSEIAEEQQQTIPTDVEKNIEKQRLAIQQLSDKRVLGAQTKKSAIPIPKTVNIPILMFHYVEYVQNKNDTMRIALNTTPFTLDNEIKTLSDAGYTFMTNKELVDALDGKSRLPAKPIVLTFDDGYRDFYTDAYPILKKYHAKATQYVISGFLNQSNHLLTSQLQEIAKDGLVEIGAHTVNHVWLKGQTLQTVTNEVVQSKSTLEKLIHSPVVSFAYPFGAFDLQALNVVKNAGFLSATSTIPGAEQTQENRYFMYRLRSGGRTGQNFLTWIGNQK